MTNQEKIQKLNEIILYIKELVLPTQEEISLNPKKMDDFIDEKVMWIYNHTEEFLTKNSNDQFVAYSVFVLKNLDGTYYNNPFGIMKKDLIYSELEKAIKNNDLILSKKILNGVACLGNELDNFKYVAYTKYSITPIRIIDLRYLALFLVFSLNQLIKKLSA